MAACFGLTLSRLQATVTFIRRGNRINLHTYIFVSNLYLIFMNRLSVAVIYLLKTVLKLLQVIGMVLIAKRRIYDG